MGPEQTDVHVLVRNLQYINKSDKRLTQAKGDLPKAGASLVHDGLA